MSEWPFVGGATNAIARFEVAEETGSADVQQWFRSAVIAVSLIPHGRPEIDIELRWMDAQPIESLVSENEEVGGPTSEHRLAVFRGTSDFAGERLRQIYERAFDSFAKDWHSLR